MKKHVCAGVVAQNTLTRPLILISGLLHMSICCLSLITQSPNPLHVLIFKSVSSSPMIIHVHLTLKQPLINCGTLGHTLGQITHL